MRHEINSYVICPAGGEYCTSVKCSVLGCTKGGMGKSTACKDGDWVRAPVDKPTIGASAICMEAANLVGGDRARTHGDKLENHDNIADLWTAYLGVEISALQAAMMLALLKVARTKTGSHNPDNYVDLAGYAGCAGEIADRTRS